VHQQLTQSLSTLGLLSPQETGTSVPEATDKAASDTSESDDLTVIKTQIEDLKNQLAEKSERIAELEKRPIAAEPPLVARTNETQELAELMRSLPPEERLRAGFAMLEQQKQRK